MKSDGCLCRLVEGLCTESKQGLEGIAECPGKV